MKVLFFRSRRGLRASAWWKAHDALLCLPIWRHAAEPRRRGRATAGRGWSAQVLTTDGAASAAAASADAARSVDQRNSTRIHFISLHFTSFHFISLHFTSFHFISLHFTYTCYYFLLFLLSFSSSSVILVSKDDARILCEQPTGIT